MDTDLYPSRILDRPQILDRADPVIYGGIQAPGPLLPDQLAFYRDHGYLFLENWLSDARVVEMQYHLQRLWSESAGVERPEIIAEPSHRTIRSIFAVHRDDAYFQSISEEPRLADMARQILASDVYVHQSRINLKTGFNGKEFGWHSDFETWHMEDGMPHMRALSISIALYDNLPVNGPVMVIPRSHYHYVACVGQTPDHHYETSLRRQEYGVPDQQSLTWLSQQGGVEMPCGRAGSVLVFDCNLMHGSNSNISPYPRSNIFLVYNSVENRLQAPFSGMPPRPPYIATRD